MNASFHHLASLVTKCIETKHLRLGTLLHSHLIKTSLIVDVFLSNRLIDMYSKCDSIESAQRVFDELGSKNTYSWNTIIASYSRAACFEKARQLLDEMREPTLVSFNSIISSLTHHGFYKESLQMFRDIQIRHGYVFMDQFTAVIMVGTCACLGSLELLHQVHGVAVVIGVEFNVVVCNAMIDAYGKCRDPESSSVIFNRMPDRNVLSWTSMVVSYAQDSRLEEASRVFDQMPTKNSVSWTALISGFTQNGKHYEALNLFAQMQAQDAHPNASTYVGVLSACADLALIDIGKQLHGFITRNYINNIKNVFLSNALIDMYSKCGNMKLANTIFERIHEKDIITWNTLITGFAQNGQGEQSLYAFNKMIEANIKPNNITFLGVLSACAHRGMLWQGLKILASMEDEFGITPRTYHYSAMVDLLGRRNRLDEAMDMISKMPKGLNNVGMWGALLSASRVHENLDLATMAAEALLKMEPENTARYVMLSNTYAAAGRWDDVTQVRRLMGERGLQKEAAFSWIDIKGIRHEFVVRDKSHIQTEEIYDLLYKLVDHIKDVYYYLGHDDISNKEFC